MDDLARALEPTVLYRAQGRFALANKLVQDFVALRNALKEVEGE